MQRVMRWIDAVATSIFHLSLYILYISRDNNSTLYGFFSDWRQFVGSSYVAIIVHCTRLSIEVYVVECTLVLQSGFRRYGEVQVDVFGACTCSSKRFSYPQHYPSHLLHLSYIQSPLNLLSSRTGRVGGGGGTAEGEGGTASLKIAAHSQTITLAFQDCPPLSFICMPPIFQGCPLFHTFSMQKVKYKSYSNCSISISCNEYHIFYKTGWKQTHFTHYYPY